MATADIYGMFWDSRDGDRTYNAASFETWLKKFFTSGVFANELQVTANSGMHVTVGHGYANVDGKVKVFEDTELVLDPASGTYPRIDTIVIRRDNTNRTITLAIVKGEYSGNTPYPTAPERTNSTYELVLAQIYVNAGTTEITTANITDTRSDSSICGFVTGTVDEIDFSQITAQWTAYFEDWFDEMKDQLSTDAAGHLQLEIDGIDTRIDGVDARIDEVETSVDIHNSYVLARPTATVTLTANQPNQVPLQIISQNGGWTVDSANRIKCPKAGKYQIIAELTFSPTTSTTTTLIGTITTNQSSYEYESRGVSTGGGAVTVVVSTIITIPQDDLVVIFGEASTATRLQGTSTKQSRIMIRGISE